MKEVTMNDYLNNMLNHNLIKKNESFFCESCKSNGLADKIYKIHSLPNNLLVGISYKNSEVNKFLRLRNFMEIDMAPFINKEFFHFKSNPFHLERPDQYKYKLVSLIVYSTSEPTKDGYITYVRQKDNSWLRFSK